MITTAELDSYGGVLGSIARRLRSATVANQMCQHRSPPTSQVWGSSVGSMALHHVPDGKCDQFVQRCHVYIGQPFDVEARLAAVGAAEFAQQLVVFVEASHDVERQVLLARCEAGQKPVARGRWHRCSDTAEANNAVAPHQRFSAGRLLHHFQQREAIAALALVGDGVEKCLNAGVVLLVFSSAIVASSVNGLHLLKHFRRLLGFPAGQHVLQEVAGEAALVAITVSGVPSTGFGRPLSPPSGPRSISQSADFDHVQVVLDHPDRVALWFVHQAVQHLQQFLDVGEVQTGGWFRPGCTACDRSTRLASLLSLTPLPPCRR